MKRLLSYAVALAVGFGFGALAQDATEKKAAAPEQTFERLEKKLSAVRTVQARFVQEKQLAMFDRKLVIEGHLAVQNPDRIAWKVDKPVRYSMVIVGAEMSQWDEDTDRVQTIRLDKNAAFKAAFHQLTAWFSGKYATLRQSYDVVIEQEAPYALAFTPKAGSGVEKVIKKVRVVFRQDERYIEEMSVWEAGGDKSVIRFAGTRLNEMVPDGVWKARPGD